MSKVIIIGTKGMMIYHHRRELIRALIDAGHQVGVIAPADDESAKLIEMGVDFHPTEIENRGTSISADMRLLWNLVKIIKKERPDVVLTFYTKTNIYGGLACRLTGTRYIENITGLGTALTGDGILHKVMLYLYREAIKGASALFFQNTQNRSYFSEQGLWCKESVLLPGSGVSLDRFRPLPYPAADEPVRFLYIGRLMKEKGIDEFLAAARIVKGRHPECEFHVVGPCDDEYKGCIEERVGKGEIIYHGKVLDTVPFMQRSHVLVFPSYYPEGMANVLLESSASSRPVITTPMPGCGDCVDDGITGLLTPPQDADALADAMEKFIDLPYAEKVNMGEAARKKNGA